MTLGLAAFPQATSHPLAGGPGKKSKLDPWCWVAQQVRDLLQLPNWKHADPIEKASVAFTDVFQRVGRRGYPL